MKSLHDLLRDYERRLSELTGSSNADSVTPEVKAILVATCKSAIEQIKRDIEDDAETQDASSITGEVR